MALVSVILPTYNNSHLLHKCINSVLSQKFNDLELIIIDDGSTDNTELVCKEFQKKDSRIEYIKIKNSGVAEARNTGLNIAKGKYICFIDSDDEYFSNYLSIMVDTMIKNDIDLAWCDYTNDNSSAETSIDIAFFEKDDAIDIILLTQKVNSVWRYIFKREKINKIQFAKMAFCEDFFFVLAYLKKVSRTAHIMSKLYYYNSDNPLSMTKNASNSKYIKDYIIIPKLVYEYMVENNLVERKFKKKLMREYAFSVIRIRRCVKFRDFKKIMNDAEYRTGLSFCTIGDDDVKKRIIFWLLKKRIYFPFLFVK